ncbi:hypothetical protein TYRP_011404 [Tyrophagus putrescentiae]|nr:hypothetical protein TYRP_011404 [Tyrophagus putrescentiae]
MEMQKTPLTLITLSYPLAVGTRIHPSSIDFELTETAFSVETSLSCIDRNIFLVYSTVYGTPQIREV